MSKKTRNTSEVCKKPVLQNKIVVCYVLISYVESAVYRHIIISYEKFNSGLHYGTVPASNKANMKWSKPSQQKIWDQQRPNRGFYMGPIWAPYKGLEWDLQHGSMWYPNRQTHVTSGNRMGPILDLAQVAHVQPTFVE